MDSILTDLWNGKICPLENLAPNTPEFKEMAQKINEEIAYIKSVLSAEDNVRFDTLQEESDLLSEKLHAEAFIRGFRLALKIAVDVYSDNSGFPDIQKLFGIDEPEK